MPYISGSLASKERKTYTPSSSIKCKVYARGIWVSFCEFISDEIFVFNIVFNLVLYSTAICQESIVRWWRWWWWCFFINDDDDDYDNDDDDDGDRAKGDMESQVQINPIIMYMIELQISIIELWLSIFGLSLWISIIVSWVAIMDCHNWTLVSIIE